MIKIGNIDGIQEAISGQIRAARTPGGNITIDTTHTVRGLIRDLGKASYGPHIEIERADLDDAIAVLQVLRGGESVAQPGAFAATGRWRVYFNKHGAAPLVWCIASEQAPGWELAVADILITTEAQTVYRPKATPDDEDGRPSAWLAVEGKLIVVASGASISATALEMQYP